MVEPDALSMPSPRSSLETSKENMPVALFQAAACDLSKDRFKTMNPVCSRKCKEWSHELKTIQAEIEAFSEMMSCRLSCERSEYSSLRLKAQSLSGDINSARLNCSAPLAEISSGNGLWHTHQSQMCGLCGIWYTSGQTHICNMAQLDGDLDKPLSSRMEDALVSVFDEHAVILTSRRPEKAKDPDDVKRPMRSVSPVRISRPRPQEVRDVDQELSDLLQNMSPFNV